MPTPNAFNQATFLVKRAHYGIQVAGAGMTIPRPNASHVQLDHLTFTLTTDANVANRQVTVSLELPAHSIILGSSHTNHAASLVIPYIATPTALINMGPPQDNWNIPLPAIRSIDATDTYAINISAVQVGDQLDHIHCYWKVWRGLS